jgi:hypothetical protein
MCKTKLEKKLLRKNVSTVWNEETGMATITSLQPKQQKMIS